MEAAKDRQIDNLLEVFAGQVVEGFRGPRCSVMHQNVVSTEFLDRCLGKRIDVIRLTAIGEDRDRLATIGADAFGDFFAQVFRR